MVKREEIEDLLLQYYEGVTTEEESRWIEEWLSASDENRKMGRHIQTITLAANVAQVSSKIDVKKALASTHRKMRHKKTGRYQRFFRGMQRAAAILFVPLLESWCVLYRDSDSRMAEMIEVRTNPGMTTSIDLPDGSVVVLNSSSSLQYPSRFSAQERKVKLVGEAFFSVVKDDEKPFVVDALNRSEIIVHGTEFNVDAYRENKIVQTTLVSGKVSFAYLDGERKKSLLMQPGQKAIYDIEQNKVVVKKANVDVETCWKDGCLIFKNTPFEDVLKELSKRYNVTFVLKNPALKYNSFTATFVRQRLERILEIFRISSNIQFKFVEDDNINTEKQIIEVY